MTTAAETAPWYRKPLCWMRLCETFRTASDDTGCWGECEICHKRVGFVSREQLRRFADAEYFARAILNQQEQET